MVGVLRSTLNTRMVHQLSPLMCNESQTKEFAVQEESAKKARELEPSVSAAAKPNMLLDMQTKAPVFNGRPPEMQRYPIHLCHPIFSEFQAHLDSNEDVPPEILNGVMQLNVVSGEIYRSELEREKAILPILQTLLNLILEKVEISGLGVKSVGLGIVQTGRFRAYPVVLGLNNEVGTGDSDPYTQVALAYQRYWAQGGESCKCASIKIVLD